VKMPLYNGNEGLLGRSRRLLILIAIGDVFPALC